MGHLVRHQGLLKPVVGTSAEVDRAIGAARASGRLQAKSRPQPVPGRPDLVFVQLQLRPESRVSWRKLALGAATLLAVLLVVALVLVVVALTWVLAHLPVILGTLAAVLLLLALLLRVGTGCPGLHCRGCRG